MVAPFGFTDPKTTVDVVADMTLDETHKSKWLVNKTANTYTATVPLDATVPYPIGSEIAFGEWSTGRLLIGSTAGLTFNSPEGVDITAGFPREVLRKTVLRKTGVNTWRVEEEKIISGWVKLPVATASGLLTDITSAVSTALLTGADDGSALLNVVSSGAIGIIASGSNNKCKIYDSVNRELYAFGEEVYGRMAFAASVYTLNYYYEINGVETAYDLGAIAQSLKVEIPYRFPLYQLPKDAIVGVSRWRSFETQYTVASLPKNASLGRSVFVTDEYGGPTLATWSGTYWQRQKDQRVCKPLGWVGGYNSTWVTRNTGTVAYIKNICWSPELRIFCASNAIGGVNGIEISKDGINWSRQTTPTGSIVNSICWSPELRLFVATLDTSAASSVITSTNGVSWVLRSFPELVIPSSVCWSPELRLFAVTLASSFSGNRVATSIDGTTWVVRSTPLNSQAFSSICWSPELGLFCATGKGTTINKIITSLDGILWTARNAANSSVLSSVCWSPELKLFCATSSDSIANCIQTSPDGGTWTARVLPASTYSLSSICWSSELRLFCVVSADGITNALLTSPNGNDWAVRYGDANTYLFSVCWSPELRIFCVGAYTGNNISILTSG
jgi:hypothetical protein